MPGFDLMFVFIVRRGSRTGPQTAPGIKWLRDVSLDTQRAIGGVKSFRNVVLI